jgi:L,D-transpeptidase YnhG
MHAPWCPRGVASTGLCLVHACKPLLMRFGLSRSTVAALGFVMTSALVACSDTQPAGQAPSVDAAPAPMEVQTPTVRKDTPRDAETVLLELYEEAIAGHHQQALDRARQLTIQLPHFQLGQMVYAELLNLSLDQPFDPLSIGGADEGRNKVRDRMGHLLAELKQRRGSQTSVAPAGWMPSNFIHLAPDQRYVVAVDVSRSRLYLLAQQGDRHEDGSPAYAVIADIYVTAGVNGIGKQVEGDGKTPEGIYFIGNSPPNRALPDLYGSGALTLNYPNALDLRRGKTGSGIWLHGTPQLQYARPPLDSDGCIVLSNGEMKRMLELPGLRGAPIVIAPKIDWVAPGSLKTDRDAFMPTLTRWHSALQTGQMQALKSFYSPAFLRNGRDLSHWWPGLVARSKAHPGPIHEHVKSILRWTDHEDHMIVTLQDNSNEQGLWRLYWIKAAGAWQIVYEGPASSPQTSQ